MASESLESISSAVAAGSSLGGDPPSLLESSPPSESEALDSSDLKSAV